MKEFKNRVASDLNKRLLEVENVERGEDGEIESLIVKVSRLDTEPTVEGTPLNADSMNTIIKNMIESEVKKYALTGTERAVLDIYELSIASEVNTNTVYLPTSGERGSVITWTSSDESIISSTGVVNRGYEDQDVVLTATVGDSELNLTKEFNVKVLKLTDSERVQLDKAALSVTSSATNNFYLDTTGSYGSTITWAKGGNGISLSGNYVIVTRKTYAQTGYLYATISYNEASDTKTFIVTIPERTLTDSERVQLDIDELSVPSSVTEDFYLETTGSNGSTITWSSSNTNRIDISDDYATVIRGSTDATVTLTAIVSYGDSEDTESFTVVVEANETSTTQLTSSYRLSHYDITMNMFTDEVQIVDGVVVSANNGTGIYVEVNNPNTDCLDIYPRNDGSMQVTVVVEEIATNMPSKDGTYDFEITIKNLNNITLGTEYITLVYA